MDFCRVVYEAVKVAVSGGILRYAIAYSNVL